MLIIGLTGGIGSGKSTVADLFAKLGIEIIDTDQLAREVVNPGTAALQKITEHFGPEILTRQKELDRKRLREIVFQAPEQRQWLEKLLHPLIRHAMQVRALHAKSPYCIAVVPLLVETKPNDLISRILVVDAPEHLQLARAMQRDGMSLEQAAAILQSQAGRAQRAAAANDIIYNDKDIANLEQQVLKLHQNYLELADQKP